MKVDSTIHANEITLLKDAIKNMATKTDIAELKAEMHCINNHTIMWMVHGFGNNY